MRKECDGVMNLDMIIGGLRLCRIGRIMWLDIDVEVKWWILELMFKDIDMILISWLW